ncbi:hypothetical protein BBF96_07060 [Anoxybacter fermentans]|uniref:Anti-sigma-W factor RsiW n=1 Tax=Anoxybacter fermentans TaxID=1323375 RepID=A0A3Q9HQC8_9FIRM|nr:zf-HC2 domain-containing protein [Anoxybacter fermentans]AZR73164.1 hypothetical protein BBF96_07060 [Anoxybacter fermentans]
MDCQNAYKLMNRYIDGEITSEEEKVLEFHLLRCRGCQKEFGEIKELNLMLNTLYPSYDFTSKVMARIEEEKGSGIRRRFKRGKWLWIGAVAVILLCIFLFSNLFDRDMELIISSGQVKTENNKSGQRELTVVDGEIRINGLAGTLNAINSQIYLEGVRADFGMGFFDSIKYEIKEIYLKIKNWLFKQRGKKDE